MKRAGPVLHFGVMSLVEKLSEKLQYETVSWKCLDDISVTDIVKKVIGYMDETSYFAFVGTSNKYRPFVLDPKIKQNGGLAYVRAMSALYQGHNVFLNGSAGCGKTVLMNRIKETFDKKNERFLQLTAPTGLASSALIDGCTIHSASGLGQGTIPMDKLLLQIEQDIQIKRFSNWKHYDILGIDEVGMLGSRFFEKCNAVAQHARSDPRVLGGVQLLIGGDFLQLAPIGDTILTTSPLWPKLNFVIIDLITSHRQESDLTYKHMLDRIRVGEATPKDIELLKERRELTKSKDWDLELVKPTHLFPHAKDVQHMNQVEFEKLIEPSKEEEEELVQAQQPAQTQAQEQQQSYVNVGYHPNGNPDAAMILDDNGNMPAQVAPEPELEEVDWLGEDTIMEYVTSIDPMTKRPRKDLRPTNRITHEQALVMIGSKIDQKVPRLLQFKKSAQYILTFNYDLPNHKSNGSACSYIGRGLLKFLDDSTLDRERLFTSIMMPIPNQKNLYIKRHQLGLRLGYAATFHGSQGMTLECAQMDLGKKCFAASTAYVGLSRLKNINSLYLSDFNEKSLKVNQVAKKFYDDLAKERRTNSDYNPLFLFIPPPYTEESHRQNNLFNFFSSPRVPVVPVRKRPIAAAVAASSAISSDASVDAEEPTRKKRKYTKKPKPAAAAEAAVTDADQSASAEPVGSSSNPFSFY